MKTLMIYGASGYPGRMAAAHAKEAGLKLVLAGRDEAPLQAQSDASKTAGVRFRPSALPSIAALKNGERYES